MSSELDSVDRSRVWSSRTSLERFVEQTKVRWRKTGAPDAANLLAQHKSIRQIRSLALELAYEDYCIRIDSGEEVDPNIFCQRFPWLRRSLSRQIDVDQFIRTHPELAQGDQPPWPRPGDPLLGFRVAEEIGAGTFARAYLCEQSDVGDRQVVVKVAYQGSFEADTMGRLSHPNIMAVYSVERDVQTQLSCLCMPFCGRSTLCEVIDLAFADQQRPDRSQVILDAARACTRRGDRYHPVVSRMSIRPGSPYVTGVLILAIQIAEALEHAHQRGVFHGDLKPTNVVLSVDATPLVVDFNLSLGPGGVGFATGGTFPYMAPEKVRVLLFGDDDADRPDGRSDIFSLGAMLYELFTGRVPFLGQLPSGEAMALGTRMLDLQSHGLLDLRRLNPWVDAGLAEFIDRCVAFEPGDRPQSMTEVCDTLRRHLSTARQSFRFLRQRRRLVLATTLPLIAGSIVGAAYRLTSPPIRDQHYQLAVEQYQQSEFSEAIENFTRSLEADSNFFPGYLGRACARIQLRLHDSPQALEAVRQDLVAASKLQPHDRRVEVAWSLFHLESRNFETAIAAMEWIVSKNETAEIRNNLGLGYTIVSAMQIDDAETVQSQMNKADDNLRRAIKLDSQLLPAHLNLAILELRRYRASGGTYIPHDGLSSIRLVVKEHPTATAAHFCAANITGEIAVRERDNDLLDECIGYLEKVQQQGFDLRSLRPMQPFATLVSDPRVDELLRREPVDRTPGSAARIAIPSSLRSLP